MDLISDRAAKPNKFPFHYSSIQKELRALKDTGGGSCHSSFPVFNLELNRNMPHWIALVGIIKIRMKWFQNGREWVNTNSNDYMETQMFCTNSCLHTLGLPKNYRSKRSERGNATEQKDFRLERCGAGVGVGLGICAGMTKMKINTEMQDPVPTSYS